MSNTHYRTTVLDYLRTGYGVMDASIIPGGKHDRVSFTHAGTRHRLTLGHDGRQTSVNMKLQDIQRLLGPPTTEQPKRERRSLEEMMPQPFNPVPLLEALKPSPSSKAEPPPRLVCRMALYTIGNPQYQRLHINVPENPVMRGWKGVGASAHGNDHWELWEDSDQKRRWLKGDARGFMKVELFNPPGTIWTPFGASPAEAVEVDGRLLITCPLATRTSVSKWTSLRKRKPSPLATKEKFEMIQQKIPTETFFGPDQTDYRSRRMAVLREIDVLERETDRRLVHVKDKDSTAQWWEWRAEVERLEE